MPEPSVIGRPMLGPPTKLCAPSRSANRVAPRSTAPICALPTRFSAVALPSAGDFRPAHGPLRQRSVPLSVIEALRHADQRVHRRDHAPTLDLLSRQLGDGQRQDANVSIARACICSAGVDTARVEFDSAVK
jgi:hypothetical protein